MLLCRTADQPVMISQTDMKLQENACVIYTTVEVPIPFNAPSSFQWTNKEQKWKKNLNISSVFPAEITAVKNGLLGNMDNQNGQSGDIMYLPHCCLGVTLCCLVLCLHGT